MKLNFFFHNIRETWADYFESVGLPAIFFSALEQFGTVKEVESDSDDDGADQSSDESEGEECPGTAVTDSLDTGSNERLRSLNLSQDLEAKKGRLYSRTELISLFKTVHTKKKVQGSITTIGLVGNFSINA